MTTREKFTDYEDINVPISKLVESERNARTMPVNDEADATLKASLKAHGLLQNLIVTKDENGNYPVEGGRRRARLLKELYDEGHIDHDMEVACLLLPDTADARELSIIENMMRTDMHIADEIDTFTELVGEGNTSAEIAARFGMPERTILQRLRLGNVHPLIRQSFREGHTSLDVMISFGATADQDLQLRVWNQFADDGGYVNAYNVKKMLNENRVSSDSRVAQFVGVEAYIANKGAYTADLFAREEGGVYLDDPNKLYAMAKKKLEAEVERQKEDGWSWVVAAFDFDYEDRSQFQTIYPVRGQLTEEEETEHDNLNARRNEIVTIVHSEKLDEEDNEYNDEFNTILERLNELSKLPRSRDHFTEEQLSYAGMVVSIGWRGEFDYNKGLVRSGDMPKEAQKPKRETRQDREKALKDRTGYSKPMMEVLRSARTEIAQQHLATSYDEAFDLMLFQMAKEVFSERSYYYATALDFRMLDIKGKGEEFREAFNESELKLAWMTAKNENLKFKRMRELTVEEKQALFAACVAATLKGQLTIDEGTRPETEAVISDLDINFAENFRPTVDNFWRRLPKPKMLELAHKVLGKKWADAHKRDKKADLAQTMENAFAADDANVPDDVTAAGRRKALAWTPDGFKK